MQGCKGEILAGMAEAYSISDYAAFGPMGNITSLYLALINWAFVECLGFDPKIGPSNSAMSDFTTTTHQISTTPGVESRRLSIPINSRKYP